MTMDGAQDSYRAIPAEMRLRHDLGVMTLIHHRRSGITHMVSEPVPQILEALDALGPSDVAAVTAHLRAHFDLAAEDGSDAATAIRARLIELATLGLVSREPV